MARKPMVNRGVMITRCRCKIVDTVTNIVSEEGFDLAGKFSNPEKILNAIRKKHETDRIKVVQLLSANPEKVVYSLPLEVFMSQATRQEDGCEEVQPNE